MNPNNYPPKPCYGAPCCWQMPSWCPNKPHSQPIPTPKPMPNPNWRMDCCGSVPAKIRRGAQPGCPMVATIPILMAATVDELKGICNAFVHVDQNNTTYYIDDQHRIVTTWAGPIVQDNYDYQANPLNVRSQEVWDFEGNRVIKYNELGEYIVLNGAPRQ